MAALTGRSDTEEADSVDDKAIDELQDPATWSDDGDEVRPPVRSPRAIVSVAFGREDFERVVEHAQRHGMNTSEYIRKAALDQLRPFEPTNPAVGDAAEPAAAEAASRT